MTENAFDVQARFQCNYGSVDYGKQCSCDEMRGWSRLKDGIRS